MKGGVLSCVLLGAYSLIMIVFLFLFSGLARVLVRVLVPGTLFVGDSLDIRTYSLLLLFLRLAIRQCAA